jgi:hypothetical protein
MSRVTKRSWNGGGSAFSKWAVVVVRHTCAALLGALLGCGAAPSGPPPTPSDGTPAPAPSAGAAAGSAAASPGAPTSAGPTAKITEVSGSAESTMYMKVTAVFENPTSRACRIPRYTLVWSGGTKEIRVDDFSIPPGESRQRSVRVHPEDGDLKKLTAESARIELSSSC